MDPTAQKNNSQQNSNYDSLVNGNGVEKSIVEPGQFVVAGEDTAPQQPPQVQPQSSPTVDSSPKASKFAFTRSPITNSQTAADQTPPPPPPPSAPETPNAPPPPPPPPPNQPPQPDPTPFSVQPNQFTPPVEGAQNQGSSKVNKFRKIFMILIVLVLVGIIAAVAYIFVIQKDFFGKKEDVKTDTSDTVLDEPLPSPQRGSGGFSTLPQSSESAQPESTGTSDLLVP